MFFSLVYCKIYLNIFYIYVFAPSRTDGSLLMKSVLLTCSIQKVSCSNFCCDLALRVKLPWLDSDVSELRVPMILWGPSVVVVTCQAVPYQFLVTLCVQIKRETTQTTFWRKRQEQAVTETKYNVHISEKSKLN